MKVTRRLLAGAILASASWTAQAAVPVSSFYSSLIVFGDSLSDPGNAAAVTELTPGAGSLFPPTPNGRFSNGATAAEVLADLLGVPTQLGWPSAAGGTNFAVGGAMTGSGNYNFTVDSPAGLQANYAASIGVSGIQSQIGLFQPSAAYGSSPLFMVQGGANDMFLGFALEQLAPGSQNFNAIVGTAVNNMAGNISALVGKGAKTIMVSNMPDLGLTPFAQGAGPGFAAQATALTNGFNTALAAAVGGIDASLGADYNIFIFDSAGFGRDAIANKPGGLVNVTDACLASAGAVASNCAGYLFWDGVHPTGLAHALTGEALYSAAMAAAVPEPEVWLLMLAGLGIVGLRARRGTLSCKRQLTA